jgi:glucose dehydrogenase
MKSGAAGAVIAFALGGVPRGSSVAAEFGAEDWRAYHGHASGDQYAALTQVNRANVGRLQLVWRHDNGGTATPANYAIDGRQYVVINTSNARNGRAPQGSAWLAFALPR